MATGVTNRILVLNNVDAATQAGDYYCEVTSPCGEKVNSDIVTLSFYSDVVITNTLTDKSSCEKSTVYFNVNTNILIDYKFFRL